jgi:hypothetical protein
MVEIDGGSAEHRRLLQEIFARFGDTQIRRVALGRHVVRPVPGDLPTPEQARAASGVALEVLAPAGRDLRVTWEAELVATAFRAAAADERLEQVAWLQSPRGGGSLQWSRGPEPPLSEAALQGLLRDLAAAVDRSCAELERVELVQPSGHGFAFRLHVAEPHAFLRFHYRRFAAAISPWSDRCARQVYCDVRDDQEEPVLVLATHGKGGASRLRRDVECCDPFVYLGTPMFSPPVPACPVFVFG